MGTIKKLDGLVCVELSPARAGKAATAVRSVAPDGARAPTTPSATVPSSAPGRIETAVTSSAPGRIETAVTSSAPGRIETTVSSGGPQRARTARITFLVGRIAPGAGEMIVVDGPTSPPFPGPWTLRAMIRPLRLLPWLGKESVH
jgi:hypothetical protein